MYNLYNLKNSSNNFLNDSLIKNLLVEVNFSISSSNNNLVSFTYNNITLNKFLNQTWAEGNNQGLRSGNYPLNETFNVFIIVKTDETIDFLATTNYIPILPTGYTFYRKIGEVYRTRGFNEVPNYPIPEIEQQTSRYNDLKSYIFKGIEGNIINSIVITPNGTYPGSNAFHGGVLLPDGRVFCVPRDSTTARIYGMSNLAKPLQRRFVLSSFYNKF